MSGTNANTPMSAVPTGAVPLPSHGPLLTRTGWSTFIVALLVVCALAPALNLLVPADSAFHLSDYMVGLLGKIMCYAICALAMDLMLDIDFQDISQSTIRGIEFDGGYLRQP